VATGFAPPNKTPDEALSVGSTGLNGKGLAQSRKKKLLTLRLCGLARREAPAGVGKTALSLYPG
jgi:hypothetical protein